jgi:hypothetical protein
VNWVERVDLGGVDSRELLHEKMQVKMSGK